MTASTQLFGIINVDDLTTLIIGDLSATAAAAEIRARNKEVDSSLLDEALLTQFTGPFFAIPMADWRREYVYAPHKAVGKICNDFGAMLRARFSGYRVSVVTSSPGSYAFRVTAHDGCVVLSSAFGSVAEMVAFAPRFFARLEGSEVYCGDYGGDRPDTWPLEEYVAHIRTPKSLPRLCTALNFQHLYRSRIGTLIDDSKMPVFAQHLGDYLGRGDPVSFDDRFTLDWSDYKYDLCVRDDLDQHMERFVNTGRVEIYAINADDEEVALDDRKRTAIVVKAPGFETLYVTADGKPDFDYYAEYQMSYPDFRFPKVLVDEIRAVTGRDARPAKRRQPPASVDEARAMLGGAISALRGVDEATRKTVGTRATIDGAVAVLWSVISAASCSHCIEPHRNQVEDACRNGDLGALIGAAEQLLITLVEANGSVSA